MKNVKLRSVLAAILAMLMICMTAVACNDGTENNNEGSSEKSTVNSTENNNTENNSEAGSEEQKTYTIKFMNGDELISETTAKTGEYVDIPADLESDDPSISFAGWVGIDDADWQAGKVEVFSSDMTYQANWYEGFGTAKQFTAKKLDGSITLDGDKDAAYDAAEAIEISTAVTGEPGATATAYIMWDDLHYYIFIEVTDSTYYPYVTGQSEIWDTDGVEFRLDLLHSTDLNPAYQAGDGWGGPYRGEPGPMVEAGFRIGAGVQLPEGTRFDGKSSLTFMEWWSNAVKETGISKGVSKATETGYTVEYVIEVLTTATDDIYRPHEGQVIGFGIKIFDKTDDAGKGKDNRICLEAINDGMDNNARALSNIKLVG